MTRRGLAANSALALGADLAGKGSWVVVTVVAARTLSTHAFALLMTCLAAAGLLTVVLDVGAQTLLSRDGSVGRHERGSLFRALAVARIPLALAALVASTIVGAALGSPLEALLTFGLAATFAAGLSYTGLLRSAQDLRPETEYKLVTGTLSIALVAAAALLQPSPAALLGALVTANLCGLLPLVRASRATATLGRGHRPRAALRRAVPLGLLSIAVVAYYRSGVIALSLLSTPKETAAYAVAANVAFGLLAVPNAITTGLLPRLAAERTEAARTAIARRALGWTLALATVLVGGTALAGPALLGTVFGERYSSAAAPLVLLSVGVLLIAASGVVGTVLVAAKTLRPLALQVGLSLAVNLAALAILAPSLGAKGAAIATIACEFVGLCVLAGVAFRRLPALIAVRVPAARRPTLDA